MSGKEKPAVTRPEASGRAGRKKAARRVVEAASAADDDKLAPSGRPEQMNDDRMDAPGRSRRLLNKGRITSYTGLAAVVVALLLFLCVLGPVQALKIPPGILCYVSLTVTELFEMFFPYQLFEIFFSI